ncbi:MAG: type II toxin-antitoxin system Phd/YefM family antitoxin [Clostridiales Family XIII bacterium]|nr:type II toxin-antitoxin system Phd/YefM family antitoxin [Clostridiales Family XIII bacterium]
MSIAIMNPSNARKNLYKLLQEVNKNHQEVQIISEKPENNAVLISLDDWNSIKETQFLEATGVMDKVRERELDDSGFTNIDEIDWDNL